LKIQEKIIKRIGQRALEDLFLFLHAPPSRHAIILEQGIFIFEFQMPIKLFGSKGRGGGKKGINIF